MLVATILQGKGNSVYTIAPDRTVAEAVAELADRRIGALVVSANGVDVAGVVSERDIVRGLAESGPALLEQPVESLMTRDVLTCSPEDTGRGILGYMTERRIRHVPVVENDRLSGMVSICDVVKSRLDEIMHEAEALREYISHT
jgi:CBS domain-containing protein